MREKIFDALTKIPGYNVLAIAGKEIKLIKTQKIALALIILYPIIVILTLGTAFSGSGGIGSTDLAIYAPNDIKDFNTAAFLEKLEGYGKINLIKVENEADVEKAIRERKAKIGLVIHQPEPTNGRYVVDLLSDNSNMVSSEFFYQIAQTSVRNVGFETSREFLIEIWGNLTKIKGDLKGETKRVDSFLEQLESSEKELYDLNESVNAIDIAEMRKKLDNQESIMGEIKPKIASFKEKIEVFNERKGSNIDAIIGAKKDIEDYKNSIARYRDRLEEPSVFCSENMAEIQAVQEVAEACTDITGAYNDLGNATTALSDATEKLDSAQNDLEATSKDLEAAKTDLEELEVMFSEANGDLNYFNTQLSSLGETIDKVNKLIVDSLDNKKNVSKSLSESRKLMDGFIDKLDDLQALSPQFLANPIIINKISVYSVNKLEIITPMALVLVLLLTTILLTGVSFVTERLEGAYSRLLLSTTGKFTIFTGKILGQLVFALLESAIILAIAILVFKVKIAGNPLEVFVVISTIAISFISLGLFISNYTKIQSTTILAGLLLVIPMIFISGIIIPLELMSEPIQQISAIEPLGVGVLLATEVMLKGTPLIALGKELATLIVPSIIFVAFTMLNKNL